jgi:hypothetical protein
MTKRRKRERGAEVRRTKQQAMEDPNTPEWTIIGTGGNFAPEL